MSTEDTVLIELIVNRRYRALSPAASRMFQLLREGVRALVAALVVVLLFRAYDTLPALFAAVGIAWAVAGNWFRQEGPGRSRVLLTESGVHYIEAGLSCDWDDIREFEVRGPVLEFAPAPELTPGLLARRRFRIPLGDATGERIKALFRERVRPGPPSPSARS